MKTMIGAMVVAAGLAAGSGAQGAWILPGGRVAAKPPVAAALPRPPPAAVVAVRPVVTPAPAPRPAWFTPWRWTWLRLALPRWWFWAPPRPIVPVAYVAGH